MTLAAICLAVALGNDELCSAEEWDEHGSECVPSTLSGLDFDFVGYQRERPSQDKAITATFFNTSSNFDLNVLGMTALGRYLRYITSR